MQNRGNLPAPNTVLVHASKPLPHVAINDLYRRFTYVHLTSYLALTRFVVIRRMRLLRFASRAEALRYIVRAALYSSP
mgnify:CR=1 FL=1